MIAPQSGIAEPTLCAEKKSLESPKDCPHGESLLNGNADKCPEDVPLPPSPDERADTINTTAAVDISDTSQPLEATVKLVEGNTTDDVKSVSLNNENDDRIDSIEVGGQGGPASAAGGTAAATSNSSTSVSSKNNSSAPATSDLKDLEQSPMSKASDPAMDEQRTTIDSSITSGDEGGADVISQVVDDSDKQDIVTENGQRDGDSSQLSAAAAAVATGEGPVEEVIVSADKDELMTETATATEDKAAVDVVESIPVVAGDNAIEDEPTIVIGEVKSVADEELEESMLPEEAVEDCVTEAESEPKDDMDTLQLDDSQEEEEDEVVTADEEQPEVRVKQEKVDRAPQDPTEIETIDIDTDDDDESDVESLVGPPLDDEEDDDDEDDVGEEEDFDEGDEDVESVGEAYEEFEVSDEENLSQEMVGDEVSDEDEARFAEMKNSHRGAKRKLSEERDGSGAGDQPGMALKERKLGW